MDNKFERCEPDDPRRCQGVGPGGQCPYKAMENSTGCARHGGVQAQNRLAAQETRNYNLTKWRARVEQMADSSKVKDLREEIGILRMLLEQLLDVCKDQNTLILYSAKISDLVLKIEKLVRSCHHLEASTGSLLDKGAVLNLATLIIGIIARHVVDSEKVDLIAGEIVNVIDVQKIEEKVGQ